MANLPDFPDQTLPTNWSKSAALNANGPLYAIDSEQLPEGSVTGNIDVPTDCPFHGSDMTGKTMHKTTYRELEAVQHRYCPLNMSSERKEHCMPHFIAVVRYFPEDQLWKLRVDDINYGPFWLEVMLTKSMSVVKSPTLAYDILSTKGAIAPLATHWKTEWKDANTLLCKSTNRDGIYLTIVVNQALEAVRMSTEEEMFGVDTTPHLTLDDVEPSRRDESLSLSVGAVEAAKKHVDEPMKQLLSRAVVIARQTDHPTTVTVDDIRRARRGGVQLAAAIDVVTRAANVGNATVTKTGTT